MMESIATLKKQQIFLVPSTYETVEKKIMATKIVHGKAKILVKVMQGKGYTNQVVRNVQIRET